jgi:hypothetical protein
VTGMSQRLMRFVGEQILPGDLTAASGAGALLVATMNVDPAAEDEFNKWYNEEHLPQLGAVPGVLSARRYRATDGESERRYLALYHLRDDSIPQTEAWTKAAHTPWTEKIGPHFRDLMVMKMKRYQRKA